MIRRRSWLVGSRRGVRRGFILGCGWFLSMWCYRGFAFDDQVVISIYIVTVQHVDPLQIVTFDNRRE